MFGFSLFSLHESGAGDPSEHLFHVDAAPDANDEDPFEVQGSRVVSVMYWVYDARKKKYCNAHGVPLRLE